MAKKKITKPKKKPTKKKLAKKKPAARKQSARRVAKSRSGAKGKSALKKARPKTKKTSSVPLKSRSMKRAEPRRGQSGDLERLSTQPGADSESVEELLEEGNTFEAGVVSGVEEAGDSQREVHTREFPEDDVPQEYLDKD